MRAKLDPMFSEYLLQVENGIEPITIADKVKLPIRIIIPYVDGVTCFDRCSILNINDYLKKLNLLINRVILSKNYCVNEINNLLINRFLSEVAQYCSFNEII